VSFAAPQFLWLFLLVPPLVLLYLYGGKKRTRTVASLLLWKQVFQRDIPPKAQRFLLKLALLFELLFLVAVIAALAEPCIESFSAVPATRVVVIDATASMKAVTENGRSRFAVAREKLEALLERFGAHDTITLFAVAGGVRPVAAEELASLAPTDSPGDVIGAVRRIRAAHPGGAYYVLSDDPRLHELEAPDTTLLPVGRRGDNAALTAFDVSEKKVFVTVANFSRGARTVTVTAGGGGARGAPVDVALDAGAERKIFIENRFGGAETVSVRTAETDALAADNAVYAAKVNERPPRVAFLPGTEKEAHLRKAFKSAGADVFEAAAPDARFDCVVLGGLLPNKLPARHAVIINPSGGRGAFRVKARAPVPDELQVADPADPLAKDVAPGGVRIRPARALEGGRGFTPLLLAGSSVVAGYYREKKFFRIVLSFSPEATALVGKKAFPIFVNNIVRALAPHGGGGYRFYRSGRLDRAGEYFPDAGLIEKGGIAYAVNVLQRAESKLSDFEKIDENMLEKEKISRFSEKQPIKRLLLIFAVLLFVLALLLYLKI